MKPDMSSAVNQLNKYFNMSGADPFSLLLQMILLVVDPFALTLTLTLSHPLLLHPTPIAPLLTMSPVTSGFQSSIALGTMPEENGRRGLYFSTVVKISVSSKTTLSSRHFSGII